MIFYVDVSCIPKKSIDADIKPPTYEENTSHPAIYTGWWYTYPSEK
jgi:hypothetical protein